MALLERFPDQLQMIVRNNAVRVLAESKQPEAALEWAMPIPAPDRCAALACVATSLHQQDPVKAGGLFQEARQIAMSSDEANRGSCMESLAVELFLAHRFEDGFAVCNEMPNDESYRLAFPLMVAARETAVEGDVDEARSLAQRLPLSHKLAVLFFCAHREERLNETERHRKHQALLQTADELDWGERDALMRFLLEMDLPSEAGDLATRTTGFTEAVAEVAAALAKRSSPDTEQVLTHSLELARENQYATEGRQISIVGSLAAALIAQGDARGGTLCDYAERHAAASEAGHLRAWALLDLGEFLLQADPQRGHRLLDQARTEIEREPDENFRWQAIRSAVLTFLKVDRLKDALQLVADPPASAEEDILWQMRDEALCRIVEHFASKGRFDEAKIYLAEIRTERELAKAQSSLTYELTKAGQMRLALAFARSIRGEKRTPPVRSIANALAEQGAFRQLESVAAQLPASEQIAVWRDLAKTLAAAGDSRAREYLERATGLAGELPEGRRGSALAGLIESLSVVSGPEESLAFARRALQMVRAPGHSAKDRFAKRRTEQVFAALVGTLARLERFEEARHVIEEGMLGFNRNRATRRLISSLAENGMFDAANAMADQIAADSPNDDPCRAAAAAAYGRGDLSQAIRLLRPPYLDHYLETLCQWAGQTGAGRQFEPLMRAVEAAFEVASWKRPDWKEVHRILARA